MQNFKKIMPGLIIVLSLLLFAPINSKAAQAPPSQICDINARILEVDQGQFPGVKIKVIKVNKIVEEGSLGGTFKCSDSEGQVFEEVVIRTEGDFSVGQEIQGEISFFADEFSSGLVLDDVEVISQAVEDEIEKENVVQEQIQDEKIKKIAFYGIPAVIILAVIGFVVYRKNKK